MRVTIHQPNYLPYLGFFDKAAMSDALILLDTVQYTKNGLQNRNRIKTPQGEMWLTVPVKTKNSFGALTKDVLTDGAKNWEAQHWKSIKANYGKAEYFSESAEYFEKIYSRKHENLADISTELIEHFINMIPKEIKIIKASEMDNKGTRSGLLLHLCKQLDATVYLSGKSGREYLETEIFEKSGVKIEFHSFKPIEYKQLWGNFTGNLSALDYLLNCGKESFGELMKK